MPSYTIRLENGAEVPVTAKEGTSDADLLRMAREQAGKPSFGEGMLASPLGRYAKGLKDPIDAAAQVLPRGLSAVASAGGLLPNSVSGWLDKEVAGLDSDIKASENEYQAARWKAGQSGFDGGRFTGNVINPTTLALAKLSPFGAASTLGRMFQGSIGGAVGGALGTQVTDTADTSFGMQKLGQAVAGAAGGAIFAPIAGKAADLIAPRWKALVAKFQDPEILGARASFETDIAIKKALSDAGIDGASVPSQVMAELRQSVLDSLKKGQKLDAAAQLRKMDFDAQKVPALRGQITRDPGQYSRDMNVRGIEGVGEPVGNVLQAQNQKITADLAKFGGPSAGEKYQAGQVFTGALKSLDDELSANVRRAYTNARATSGKDWDVPTQGLAHDVQTVLDDFGVGAENNAVPSAIAARLQKLGIIGDGMTQRKVFNYEEADKLLKQINAHDNGQNASIGALRASVKRALLEGGGDGDPFAPARKLAASRFAMLDAIPALEAVSKAKNPQEVSRLADDFVQKHIVGAKVADLQKLAGALPSEAMDEAKKQIARVIYEGAFKGNAAGDKMASPAGLQSAMKSIGTDRLKVFFSQAEIDELNRLTRITAFANSEPAWGTVARGGNPGGVLFGGIAKLGGQASNLSAALPLIGAAKGAMRANSALDTSVPKTANLSPEEVAKLARLMNVGSVVSGGLLAPRP